MKKVYILYKFLPHYRKEFFNLLRKDLLKHNIELHLLYGKMKNSDSLKKDEVDISWAEFVDNKVLKIGNKELYWQPCLKKVRDADLVIVEQANKLLINFVLMFSRFYSKRLFSFWGHGRDMQSNPNSFLNKFKATYLKKCDWWFAYTEGVKQSVASTGFPSEKITVVQNAIDTQNLVSLKESLTAKEKLEIKNALKIKSDNIAIYCGGMYKEKRIEFVLECCFEIQKRVPDFNILFLGSGIDAVKVEEAATKHTWIHYIGPSFGKDKVLHFSIAKMQLMPGLVGLGILDSFALETPIFTTEYPYHSPEIEYLRSDINGVITPDTQEAYVKTVCHYFENQSELDSLINGCKKARNKYTVENMVANFSEGIKQCLNS